MKKTWFLNEILLSIIIEMWRSGDTTISNTFKSPIVQLNLQLIPNYFKNEKFVKLNTIITNDNVHEEAKYFSYQTCDKYYT